MAIETTDIHLFEECCVIPCAQVYVATFAAPPWNEAWSLESAQVRLRELFETPRSFGLVAEGSEGQAVGFVLGSFVQGATDTLVRVAELCVRPDAQRHGVGRRLLGEFERLAADQGATSVTLTTGPETADFYVELGYRRQSDWIPMARALP